MDGVLESSAVLVRRSTPRQRLRSWSQRHWWHLLFSGVAAVLLYLVGGPLFFVVVGGFTKTGLLRAPEFTLEHYRTVFLQKQTYRLILNTIVFGAGSLTVASCFSIPLAFFVERTTLPFKNLFRTVIISAMAIPALLKALSWTLLASPRMGLLNSLLENVFGVKRLLNIYSLYGMIFVEGLALTPLLFIMLSPAFRNFDATLEEAGQVSGVSFLRIIRRISIPLVLPAVLASVLYGFTVSLVTFDIAGSLGIPAGIFVLSSHVYYYINEYSVPRYGPVSVIAVLTLVLSSFAIWIYRRSTRHVMKYAVLMGKAKMKPLELSPTWRYVSFSILGLYLLCAIVLPLIVLVWNSFVPYYTVPSLKQLSQFSWKNYAYVLNHPYVKIAVRNTLINGAVSATVATFLAALTSWILIKSPVKSRHWLDILAFLPLIVPGVILGLSLRFIYLTLYFIPIYGTLWIITVAHVTDALPFTTRNLNTAFIQVHKELEEAGLVGGANWTRIFCRITLPLVAPTIVFCWLWALLRSVRELSAAIMLYSTNSTVLSTMLWRFWYNGDITRAAAVGVMLIVGLFILTFVALGLVQRARSKVGLM